MLQLQLKSLNKESLTFFNKFIIDSLSKLNLQFTYLSMPKKSKVLTLLKSPHVHKSSREQFEITKHKTIINIKTGYSSNLVNFLILNKPKTVKIIIRRIV